MKEDDESTFETEEPESGQLVYITNLENGLQMDGTELNDEIGPNEKKPIAYNRPTEMPSLNNLKYVEKSVFSIWVDLLLCRSIQLLVLSYAEMFVCMYLSQLMSTFTKLSKGASSSRWFLQSMTRRTSDSTITHMYLYTHVSQI